MTETVCPVPSESLEPGTEPGTQQAFGNCLGIKNESTKVSKQSSGGQ